MMPWVKYAVPIKELEQIIFSEFSDELENALDSQTDFEFNAYEEQIKMFSESLQTLGDVSQT